MPLCVLWPLGMIALCVAHGDESIADWGGLNLKDELQTTAAVAALSYTAWSALIGFGLVGLGLSVILPITYRAGGSTPGISRGKAVASVATIGYLGFLAGPPIIDTVADAASLRGALFLVGVVTIALVPLSRSTAPRIRMRR